MWKQYLILGLLFFAGIAMGAFFTPVGMDMHDDVIDREVEGPVHQKPQSNSDIKQFYSQAFRDKTNS